MYKRQIVDRIESAALRTVFVSQSVSAGRTLAAPVVLGTVVHVGYQPLGVTLWLACLLAVHEVIVTRTPVHNVSGSGHAVGEDTIVVCVRYFYTILS